MGFGVQRGIRGHRAWSFGNEKEAYLNMDGSLLRDWGVQQ